MVTDQHWATGAQIKHDTLSNRIRERRPEQNGPERVMVRRADGRLFHTSLSDWGLYSSHPSDADCSRGRPQIYSSTTQSFCRQTGSTPRIHFPTRIAVSNTILCRTGSQWSLCGVVVVWSRCLLLTINEPWHSALITAVLSERQLFLATSTALQLSNRHPGICLKTAKRVHIVTNSRFAGTIFCQFVRTNVPEGKLNYALIFTTFYCGRISQVGYFRFF